MASPGSAAAGSGAVGGAVSGAQLGSLVLPGIGTAIGAVVGAVAGGVLGGSGGAGTHGRGSAGRAENESKFVAKKLLQPVAQNQADLATYVAKYTTSSGKVCGKASDPASCRDLVGRYQEVISTQTTAAREEQRGAALDQLLAMFAGGASPSGFQPLGSAPSMDASGAAAPSLPSFLPGDDAVASSSGAPAAPAAPAAPGSSPLLLLGALAAFFMGS